MEKKIEIIGIMESKLKIEGMESLRTTMGDDWDTITNTSDLIANDRASIIISFKIPHWSLHIIYKHRQILHVGLTNMGGTFLTYQLYMEKELQLNGRNYG